MGLETFLVSSLAALLAGVVSGLSGFGYALVSVPLFLLVLEPTAVIVVSAFVGLFTNVLVVFDSFHDVRKRLVGSLLPWAVAGQVLGLQVLLLAEPVYIRLAAGLLVIAFSVVLLRGVTIPGLNGRGGAPVAGFLSGLLSTSTGLAGPPVVMLFAARHLQPRGFRASNGAYFLAISAVTVPLLLLRGMIEGDHLLLAAVLIPAAFIGKSVGARVFDRLPRGSFRPMSLYLALGAGVAGIVSAALDFL